MGEEVGSYQDLLDFLANVQKINQVHAQHYGIVSAFLWRIASTVSHHMDVRIRTTKVKEQIGFFWGGGFPAQSDNMLNTKKLLAEDLTKDCNHSLLLSPPWHISLFNITAAFHRWSHSHCSVRFLTKTKILEDF